MKLYATVTSERASKGQGGNEYIEIILKVQDRVKPIGMLVLTYHEDSKVFSDYDEWTLRWKETDREDWHIVAQGHVSLKTKSNNPYDYSKTPTAKLEKELKEFQVFLSDENSSIGRQDFFMEQAMIRELERRDKTKGNKQKGEDVIEHYTDGEGHDVYSG